MSIKEFVKISGKNNNIRIDSRILEEKIQKAVGQGYRKIEVDACGQHGIGGRLWRAGKENVFIRIFGQAGQRAGSLGFPNTSIEIMGPVSDDVGWLNAGAEIVVHGHAANGVANGMAQGKIYISGNIGSRGMTMTKYNPRFEPPEIWVLGSVGDYFGEFMAGGIAVVCGVDPQDSENILGYRPLVGMVGGKVFFRGPHSGYSEKDAKLVQISDEEWNWLIKNISLYLNSINRTELFDKLSHKDDWQLLCAKTPREKRNVSGRSMSLFKKSVWDKELGKGGLIGDLSDIDNSQIGVIATGDLRRFVPVWENMKYMAPCQFSCPTGIPVQKRWSLIREGLFEEAIDLSLIYSPFPATVCGYLCPNLCMDGCTRGFSMMTPIDITMLGKASVNAKLPDLPDLSGKRVAVIGGGPSGLSVAWQLRQMGHEPVVYDMAGDLGGKISSLIPESRIPHVVLTKEIEKIKAVLSSVNLKHPLQREDTEKILDEFDCLVLAAGAQKPRTIPVPGKELMIAASDFLKRAKKSDIEPGEKVVIIGAGNVGCDVATEACRLGASDITLIDVQEPAAFGKEKEDAEKAGAKFMWPCFTKEITREGIILKSGKMLLADTVVISIGDVPDIDLIPKDIETLNGFIVVDEHFKTSNPKVFAIGDMVAPGLLTDSIGSGRKAAYAIDSFFQGSDIDEDISEMIDMERVSLEYYDPRIKEFDDDKHCGSQCASCGSCRDCGICVAICPEAAISRKDKGSNKFEYIVDGERCIGCGFCAGACPCGIWSLEPNAPLF